MLKVSGGKERIRHFIETHEPDRLLSKHLAGDVVDRKKPAPDIYLLALTRLGLPAEDCVAIEDSRNGLLSAHQAGIATIITPGIYTDDQNFDEAVLVATNLDDVDFPALYAAFIATPQ